MCKRLRSPQFNLELELRESRWQICLVHLNLTVEPDVIFLHAGRDDNDIPLASCMDSIKEHLRDVNVSHRCVSSEKELILARVGLFGGSEGHYSTVCPKHRARLGVKFRPSTKCQHPLHGNRRGKVERGVNLKMAREVKAKWNTVVPVGAGNSLLHFASSCRLIIYRIVVRRVTYLRVDE